ncbi:MAG TPA: AAA family ATPase, partial [Candidatus Eremiobacteraceae bacterium]|nr:AAA family ATPase [Candidatus Eremiobacteraceae bacterium]
MKGARAVLRIKLLGTGHVFDGNSEIKLPSRASTLPLLAYIVLHGADTIPRSQLAFTLWPDEPEQDSLHDLRRKLHLLLKSLPSATGEAAPWIVVDGDTVAWNTARVIDFDVARFERLRADPSTLEQAVALYEGDLLEEIYDDWIVAERERLRGLYLADLNSLILASRSRRAFDTAAAYAKRLLRADPWREDTVRHLISARYEAGDAAGALAEFDRFARTLRAEMNVDPMPETLVLRDAVAHGAPIAGSPVPPQSAKRRARTAPPFVGREAEFTRLREQWLHAASGSGALALVRGEAGIGKSRLVSQLALLAESQGGRVVTGFTSAPEKDPFQCISTALRGALPLVAGIALAPPLMAAVAELVPELRGHRDDIPPLVRIDPTRDRTRLLDALAQLLAALARPRPLMVVLEDLHRASKTTIEALGELLPRLSRSTLLMVVTYRDEDLSRSHPLRDLERSAAPTAQSIVLGPLGDVEIRSLVEAVAPQKAASPGYVRSLIARSGGNPLFVTELLRDAQRATGEASDAIPASIRQMVADRLDSLTRTGRVVAEVAAVAGEDFTVEVIREIAALPDGALLDGLDELLDRHLVRESTESRYEYAFTHHVVHAAIYNGMDAQARSRRHRRVARKLAASVADDLGEGAAEIALHFELGGEPRQAAVYYERAARRAARLNANAEACDLIGRALQLGGGNDRQRFGLLLLRSRLHARLSEPAAERADLDELESVAKRLDDGDAACCALERRVDLAYRETDRKAESDALEQLERRAEKAASERWLAVAAEARSKRAQSDGDYAACVDSALDARDRYSRLGDDAACARVSALAARTCSVSPGRVEEAKRLIADALRLADRSGDSDVRLMTLSFAAAVSQELLDYERHGELVRAALALSLEIGDRQAEAAVRGSLGLSCRHVWRMDEAVSQFREAVRITDSLALKRTSAALCNFGATLGDVGDFPNAVALLRRAMQDSVDAHVFETAAVAAGAIADIAWQSGDLQALKTAVHEASEIARRLPESRFVAYIVLNQGRLSRCEGEFDESVGTIERSIALYERSGRSDNVSEALLDLALTYLASGRPRSAREAMTKSLRVDDARDGQELSSIRRSWIDACIHHAAGSRKDSRLALERASQTYHVLLGALHGEDLHASFRAIPVHRAIESALSHDEWPPPDSRC